MLDLNDKPQGWSAQDAETDLSWTRRMSVDAISGVEAALAHAKRHPKSFLSMTPDDFPLNGAAKHELQQAFDSTQKGWGFCLLKGFPMRKWSEADVRLVYWGMALHFALARTQNFASDILNDVRDEGSTSYYTKGGRGYNTSFKLDFHIDFCDVVSLFCRRVAKEGGRSLIASSIAVVEEIRLNHSGLADALEEPLAMSWQGSQAPGEPPTYMSPLAGIKEGWTAFRTNRKNIVAAQRDFPDAPRWTKKQEQLVDLIDQLVADERFCYSMYLEEGDMQLLNNFVVVHSRTEFKDYDEPDEKRHLLRLWLNLPNSQPLPDSWAEAFKDVRAGAVRGGVRGSGVTSEFIEYEIRQANHLGMRNAFSERFPATSEKSAPVLA